jgi:hypothetical protein
VCLSQYHIYICVCNSKPQGSNNNVMSIDKDFAESIIFFMKRFFVFNIYFVTLGSLIMLAQVQDYWGNIKAYI